MLFRDTIALYSENHTSYINTHLPLVLKHAAKFPNTERCLLKYGSVDKHKYK
jgi:hypothetical protein